jgi:hypothetical protein
MRIFSEREVPDMGTYRNTDPRKWHDNWFKKWGLLEQWLLQWLFDHCDLGGYVELDWDELEADIKITPPLSLMKGIDTHGCLSKALDTLQSPSRGFRRIHVREHPARPDKMLVWLTNHSKIQCNGKTNLNPQSGFERRVLTDLSKYKDYFPVCATYMGIDGLRRALVRGRGKGGGGEGKGQGDISLSSSSQSGAPPVIPPKPPKVDEAHRGESKAYDEILDSWPVLAVTFQQFLECRASHPCSDAEAFLIVHKTIKLIDGPGSKPTWPGPYLLKQFSKFEVDKELKKKAGKSGQGKRPSKDDVKGSMK